MRYYVLTFKTRLTIVIGFYTVWTLSMHPFVVSESVFVVESVLSLLLTTLKKDYVLITVSKKNFGA